MSHDKKLLNEIKVLLEADLMELEFLGYSRQQIFEFFDIVESIAHNHALDALDLRDDGPMPTAIRESM